MMVNGDVGTCVDVNGKQAKFSYNDSIYVLCRGMGKCLQQ